MNPEQTKIRPDNLKQTTTATDRPTDRNWIKLILKVNYFFLVPHQNDITFIYCVYVCVCVCSIYEPMALGTKTTKKTCMVFDTCRLLFSHTHTQHTITTITTTTYILVFTWPRRALDCFLWLLHFACGSMLVVVSFYRIQVRLILIIIYQKREKTLVRPTWFDNFNCVCVRVWKQQNRQTKTIFS